MEGNAECLPFEDGSFDLYTIAFGLRNVTNRWVTAAKPLGPPNARGDGLLDQLMDGSIV